VALSPAVRTSAMSVVVDLPDCSRRVWWLWSMKRRGQSRP
jgi:hypothetical protein